MADRKNHGTRLSPPKSGLPSIIPQERIEQRIYLIRGQKVMLSHDLADLYNVAPMRLNEAVKRNIHRFPADFMFKLFKQKYDNLKSQIAISSWGGARRATPYAFTEEGVAMLSAVLRSDTAIAVSIQIIRTFVRLRQLLTTHADLARKVAELEKKYDRQFATVFEAIRQLMAPSDVPTKPRIGFATEKTNSRNATQRISRAKMKSPRRINPSSRGAADAN